MRPMGWVSSRTTTWVLAVLTSLAVVVFAISIVPGVRASPGFDPIIDGWLQGGTYVLIALVALRSLIGDSANRRLRLGLVAALVLEAAGFVLFVGIVRRSQPTPYPSIADGSWLAAGVLFVVGVSYVAWRHSPRATLTLVLDAVVGAFVVAGVVVSLLFDTLVGLADPALSRAALLTNLAYPIFNVALLMVVLGLLVAVRGRTTAAVWAMSAGAVASAAVDFVFFYQLVEGTFRPGSPLAALSLAANAVLAWSCMWLEAPSRTSADDVRGLVTPAVLASAGLLMLFVDAVRGAPLLGLVLLTTGILVAIVRALLTRQQDSTVSTDAIEEKQLELERFKSLVEASSDFVAIATHEGAILYVNPRGRDMIGLAQDFDVTTTSVADYVDDDSWEEWTKVRRPAMYEHGRWQGERYLRHWSGGAPVPVASSGFLVRHPRTGEPWLLATVQRDISARLVQQAEVQRLADERQVLLAHLVEAQEDERARIAADVHDDSVQALSAVELRLHLMRQSLEHASPEVLNTVSSFQDTVRGATDRLRHLLFDLESPARETDIATALQGAAAYVLEDSVSWTVEAQGEPDLPVAVRVIAYRIAKEALVNIRKHAEASHVTVRVDTVDGGVEVTVADDGRGFDVDGLIERPGHLGLRGMHDRAAVAGGRVDVVSAPGVGTTVRIWLPGMA